ncbi:ABC transporter permease [Galactobacter caseinivorans]|uniref:ABC transporter permease n=1 Tax=Galactobacter caseinivorans TaxID=2676123 RepID=A0A496PI07_9MICC|nr:ABC transporter permease [Galactobacter caseinivorans]RKW70126.1 ABC transporter permease [Galactobacter caseinivorans]
MWNFVTERWQQILFASYQHLSLVVQCLILATVLAVIIAVLTARTPWLAGLANGVSAVGLTIPSFAMIGLMIGPLGFGPLPSVVVVTFFAVLPILRNALVGLNGVPAATVEAARGLGMSRLRTLATVELPMAWPVIMSGIRVSAQMVMGVAAVAAFVLGPGLGTFIFNGLSRLGGANSLNSVVVGVVGVVILALILDLALVGLSRLTIRRGLRV